MNLIPSIAAALALGIAAASPARAEMPTPLFCEAVAVCGTAQACTTPSGTAAFVLRRTEGEWLRQTAPSAAEVWVVMAPSAAALSEVPAGARVVTLPAGMADDGAYLLNEYVLEDGAISRGFTQLACLPGAGTSP